MTYLQKIKNLKNYLESYRKTLTESFRKNKEDQFACSTYVGGIYSLSIVLEYLNQIEDGNDGDLKKAIKEATKINEKMLKEIYPCTCSECDFDKDKNLN